MPETSKMTVADDLIIGADFAQKQEQIGSGRVIPQLFFATRPQVGFSGIKCLDLPRNDSILTCISIKPSRLHSPICHTRPSRRQELSHRIPAHNCIISPVFGITPISALSKTRVNAMKVMLLAMPPCTACERLARCRKVL
jgi:hypothetical protein